MIGKKMQQRLLATFMLTSSLVTAAHATEPSCPGVSTVKGAVEALNTVMRQSQDSYFVLTAQPAINESNLDWLLIVQSQGNSFDPAFTAAYNDVKSVSMSVSDTAIEMQGMYVCAYFTSSGGMNVLAISPQQQGGTVDPLKLKLTHLKFNH